MLLDNEDRAKGVMGDRIRDASARDFSVKVTAALVASSAPSEPLVSDNILETTASFYSLQTAERVPTHAPHCSGHTHSEVIPAIFFGGG